MKQNKMKVVHQNTEPKQVSVEENSSLYEILKELPKPETSLKLSASQKRWWYWFGVEFISTNQFSKMDLMHLQNAAVSMDARCKLIKKINDLNKADEDGVAGWVQVFPSKATNVTGYQTMYEKATKQLDDVSAHFGLSIKDRNKIKAVEGPNDNQLNLFDEMYKKLHG